MSAFTRNQQEVLDQLSRADSSQTADWVSGDMFKTAMNLAAKKVLNIRFNDHGDIVFWRRQEGEESTGAYVPAGFVVVLNKNIVEPSGKAVNFFVARTKAYDLTQKSFRLLLAGWLKELGLRPADLLRTIPVDQIPYDSPIFANPGHVVLED